MEKGKGVVMMGRRWAVDFTDNSTTPSSRDIPDPPGFSRSSSDQDDSTLSRQKKDAEANWKSQMPCSRMIVKFYSSSVFLSYSASDRSKKRGCSVVGYKYIRRDRWRGHERLFADYFAANP
ncbi:unnamed protein product [Camellia sinensis]